MIKPGDKPQAWDHHATMDERLDACRTMLVIHGFMSDAENGAVRERINKWRENDKRRKRKADNKIPTMGRSK